VASRARSTLPGLKDRLTLGANALSVSPFCQGMLDDDPAFVLSAYDAGINFFFVSCDLHWPYYDTMRRGLAQLFARGRGIRDRVVVAAVTYIVDPETSIQARKELLDAVPGLDRLDVLVAGMVRETEIGLRLHALERALAEAQYGARAIGATFHERAAAAYALRNDLLDVVWARYNPAHPGAAREIFPHRPARARAKTFAFKTTDGRVPDARWSELGLTENHWQPSFADHYRFALSAKNVDGLLVGLGEAQHLRDLRASLRDGPVAAGD